MPGNPCLFSYYACHFNPFPGGRRGLPSHAWTHVLSWYVILVIDCSHTHTHTVYLHFFFLSFLPTLYPFGPFFSFLLHHPLFSLSLSRLSLSLSQSPIYLFTRSLPHSILHSSPSSSVLPLSFEI